MLCLVICTKTRQNYNYFLNYNNLFKKKCYFLFMKCNFCCLFSTFIVTKVLHILKILTYCAFLSRIILSVLIKQIKRKPLFSFSSSKISPNYPKLSKIEFYYLLWWKV